MVFDNTINQSMPSLNTIHSVMPLNSMTPVVIQLPMRGAPDRHPQMVTSSQPLAQIGFPFNVAHITNHLLLPTEERQRHMLLTTVMPNVAGYCDWCGKRVQFMGTTSASLFPETSDTATKVEAMDTAGTHLEKELMELVEHTQGTQLFSPSSFMDSEFEETDSSPPDLLEGSTVSTNSYGRPIAGILPTPRAPQIQARDTPQPIPIYPPNFRSEKTEKTDFQIFPKQ